MDNIYMNQPCHQLANNKWKLKNTICNLTTEGFKEMHVLSIVHCILYTRSFIFARERSEITLFYQDSIYILFIMNIY